jgi:archaellum component FlaC
MKKDINTILSKRLEMLSIELENMKKRNDTKKEEIIEIKGQIKEVKSIIFILA